MQALRRGAQVSCRSSRSLIRQQQRRFESHGSEHAQTPPPPHVDSANPNESLGRVFYIGVTCIPLAFVIHDLATSKDPWLTRTISHYSDWREEWSRRNNVHLEVIQQAAADRNLFLNSKPPGGYHLKYPEQFNTGSQHNVWAGAYINLDKVIAHYEKINREHDEAVLERLAAREQEEEPKR